MNYKLIFNTLGWVLMCVGALMLIPAICAIIYGEKTVFTFLFCIAVSLALGGLFSLKPPKNKTLYSKEGYIIVALSWIIISIIGALPFFISGYIPNFIDAVFETASGFTTTGASILTDVEILPKSLLFWRSFTHWIGGMGVFVFIMAVMPLMGGSTINLMRAESTGPSVGRLVPRVKDTAKILYLRVPSLTDPLWHRARNILEIFEGALPVSVYDTATSTYQKQELGFDCTPYTLSELAEILGADNVVAK